MADVDLQLTTDQSTEERQEVCPFSVTTTVYVRISEKLGTLSVPVHCLSAKVVGYDF